MDAPQQSLFDLGRKYGWVWAIGIIAGGGIIIAASYLLSFLAAGLIAGYMNWLASMPDQSGIRDPITPSQVWEGSTALLMLFLMAVLVAMALAVVWVVSNRKVLGAFVRRVYVTLPEQYRGKQK